MFLKLKIRFFIFKSKKILCQETERLNDDKSTIYIKKNREDDDDNDDENKETRNKIIIKNTNLNSQNSIMSEFIL